MSTPQSIPTQTTDEVEVITCAVCQEASDLQPWPCCGQSTACGECCEYNRTCEDCQGWQDRGMSIASW